MKIKKILRLSAEDSGGRNRTRTCDPIDVNDVLYQLSHATMPFDSKGILSRTGFAVKDEII